MTRHWLTLPVGRRGMGRIVRREAIIEALEQALERARDRVATLQELQKTVMALGIWASA